MTKTQTSSRAVLPVYIHVLKQSVNESNRLLRHIAKKGEHGRVSDRACFSHSSSLWISKEIFKRIVIRWAKDEEALTAESDADSEEEGGALEGAA